MTPTTVLTPLTDLEAPTSAVRFDLADAPVVARDLPTAAAPIIPASQVDPALRADLLELRRTVDALLTSDGAPEPDRSVVRAARFLLRRRSSRIARTVLRERSIERVRAQEQERHQHTLLFSGVGMLR
ncbi:hypothetical protein ACXET9_04210 [Brachybacterium sp. DNPG3]